MHVDEDDAFNVRVFRILIAVAIVMPIVHMIVSFLPLYSAAALDAYRWQGHEAILPPDPVYYWLYLFLNTAALISLRRFSWAGRAVIKALSIANAVIGGLSGIYIGTGLDSALYSIDGPAFYGSLVMAWTPPFSHRFRRSVPAQ